MAAWQWVFTSPGITSLPRQSNSRSPGCAARNSAAAVSDSVTSAMRLPSTPTQPAKVRGAFPAAVIGSTVAFEKRIAIFRFIMSFGPGQRPAAPAEAGVWGWIRLAKGGESGSRQHCGMPMTRSYSYLYFTFTFSVLTFPRGCPSIELPCTVITSRPSTELE